PPIAGAHPRGARASSDAPRADECRGRARSGPRPYLRVYARGPRRVPAVLRRPVRAARRRRHQANPLGRRRSRARCGEPRARGAREGLSRQRDGARRPCRERAVTMSESWPGAQTPKNTLPERIAHFKVIDRIGRGAMGVVYSARDERNDRSVALKVMMADLEGDKETRMRFEREAKVAGDLLPRNVINVYEMGEDDGRLYMVMELLQGEPLNEYLKRVVKLPLERTLDMRMQVCEGLAVAHAHGIVHRDINPGNLFVLKDGGVKILDFGVARPARSTSSSAASRGGRIPACPPAASSSGRRISCRRNRRGGVPSISGPTS